MNTVLKVFLSMSLSGSLLILALFAAGRLWKDKFSRQWQYYIWLAALLRLLLPLGPETSLMGKTYQAIDRAITQSSPLPVWPNTPELSSVSGNQSPQISQSSPTVESVPQNADNPAETSSAGHSFRDIAPPLVSRLWLVWLIGALILLIRKITIYQSFIQYIAAGSSPVSNTKLLDRLSLIAEQIGVKGPVELCVNPLISSPLLTGFFRPCIVLPSLEIPERDFQYIILHELTHYKRRDMFYKWLVQAAVCLHWFNPFVHLMSREITKACEFSCDEAVLVKMGRDKAQEYGKTLLDAMASVGKYKEFLGSVTLAENKQLLKERLGAIMKFKMTSKKLKTLTSLLTLCIVLSASFIGIYPMKNSVDAMETLRTADISSLSLNIINASVNVLSAPKNEKIHAEFSEAIYKVDIFIDAQKDEWTVSVSSKANPKNETVTLYLPDISYDNVKLNVNTGYLDCGNFKSGNITGNFNMSYVLLTLPEGFAGSVDAAASGCFQLVFKDDFKNTSASIATSGECVISKPQSFKKNGNTYTEGSASNVIKITQSGSCMMGIHTSDTSDFLDFSDQWDFANLWKNGELKEDSQTEPQPKSNDSEQAEKYYQSGSLPLFQISFFHLDKEAQEKWMDRIYTDDQIAFWGAAVDFLDEDCGLVQRFAEKTYGDSNISYFSVLANRMSEKTLERYLDKSLKDGKWAFQSVLYNLLDRKDEFDEQEKKKEKEWAEALKAQYQAAGVTMIDEKNYYYQGQLVDIFLDQRTNQSFYTLNMNPAGTVNIKILRNANDKITGVSYMTKAEIEELFGDMED